MSIFHNKCKLTWKDPTGLTRCWFKKWVNQPKKRSDSKCSWWVLSKLGAVPSLNLIMTRSSSIGLFIQWSWSLAAIQSPSRRLPKSHLLCFLSSRRKTNRSCPNWCTSFSACSRMKKSRKLKRRHRWCTRRGRAPMFHSTTCLAKYCRIWCTTTSNRAARKRPIWKWWTSASPLTSWRLAAVLWTHRSTSSLTCSSSRSRSKTVSSPLTDSRCSTRFRMLSRASIIWSMKPPQFENTKPDNSNEWLFC